MEKIVTYLNSQTKTLAAAEFKGTAVTRTYFGEDTWVASASYVPFVSAAVLVLRKNNSEFVSFHARQALVILLIAIFALVILPTILKTIAAITVYAILVFGAYQALKGRKWYFPIVTELANTIDL